MEERGERKGMCDGGSIRNLIPLEVNLNLNHPSKGILLFNISYVFAPKTNILLSLTHNE